MAKFLPKKSYWNNNGVYQSLVDRLNHLVPACGEVDNPRKNRKLERFRIASNCYYDLYNNGLCNRASEFRRVFGVASSKFGSYSTGFGDLYEVIEPLMDDIIAAAALEQGIAKLTVQEI